MNLPIAFRPERCPWRPDRYIGRRVESAWVGWLHLRTALPTYLAFQFDDGTDLALQSPSLQYVPALATPSGISFAAGEDAFTGTLTRDWFSVERVMAAHVASHAAHDVVLRLQTDAVTFRLVGTFRSSYSRAGYWIDAGAKIFPATTRSYIWEPLVSTIFGPPPKLSPEFAATFRSFG